MARLAGLDYELGEIRGKGALSWLRDRRVWDNLDDIVEFFQDGLKLTGCKSAKLKGGVFDPWYEVRVMKALKSKMPEINWIWDPNGAMQTPELAHEVCNELADVCQFIEDPVLTQETMAATQKLLGNLPLATNMCAPDMDTHESARKSGAFKISLAGDIHYSGGLDNSLQFAYWCLQEGFGFGNHSNLSTSISNMATAHMGVLVPKQVFGFDTHGLYSGGRELVPDSIVPVDGQIRVHDDSAGLGFEVNQRYLRDRRKAAEKLSNLGIPFHARADVIATKALFKGYKPISERDPGTPHWMLAGVPGYEMPKNRSFG